MKAADVMTRHVVSVTGDVSVRSIATMLLEHGISAVPVVDTDGKVIGMVSEGDLMRRHETQTERRRPWWLRVFADPETTAGEYAKAHGRTAREVMTRDVIQVSEDTAVDAIADLLERHRIKRVPVTRDGRLVGIVSRANLLQGLASAPGLRPEIAADDRAIRLQLAGELEARGFGAGVAPNIVVHDGVVHLWGSVASSTERNAVRVAAESIPGVVRVVDHTIVPPPILY